MKKLSCVALICFCSYSLADDANKSDLIDGTVDLGYSASSGNSDASSLSFRVTGDFKTGHYEHQTELQALSAASDGVTSKEAYLASYQLNRDITENTSWFGRVEYNNDRFSGYEFQNVVTTGASVDWIMPEAYSLTTEAGVGYRDSAIEDEGHVEEAILRLAGNFNWQVSDNTKFSQSLSTEAGEESTISRSVSSVAVAMSEALALKVTYQFKHYSDPEPDTVSLDRTTSVSITYSY